MVQFLMCEECEPMIVKIERALASVKDVQATIAQMKKDSQEP